MVLAVFSVAVLVLAVLPFTRSAREGDRLVRRSVQLVLGLILYAVSMAIFLHAAIGSMPWDVLSQGLVQHVPLSIGGVTFVTGLLVLLCWIPLRQRPGIGTVANVLVISALVDPFLALLGRLPQGLPLPIAVGMVVVGVALNGLATALYIGARMGPGPRDGLMTGVVRRTGRSVRLVRSSIEITVVAVGWVLGGVAGPATLLYALAIGPLVHVLLPRFTVPTRVPTDASVRTGMRAVPPEASAVAAAASGTRE